MPETTIIVNPTAGAGRTKRLWPQINALLKNTGLRFRHRFTEAPGHAAELAIASAKQGSEFVVCVGGDGTVHEVVNGLYASGRTANVTVGIISTGTGTDYIRTLGIPRDLRQACERLLTPNKRKVDAGTVEAVKDGRMTKRLFVNFAGLGFDAEIVKATTQRFKTLGGKASYLAGLLATLVTYRNKRVSLNMDGTNEERTLCTLIASNGKYGGGSMLVAPDADITDGLFDVIMIGDLDKLDLVRSLPRIYRGTHLTHPKVTARKARVVEILSSQPVPIQADGELIGETPARFRVEPGMLTLAV